MLNILKCKKNVLQVYLSLVDHLIKSWDKLWKNRLKNPAEISEVILGTEEASKEIFERIAKELSEINSWKNIWKKRNM